MVAIDLGNAGSALMEVLASRSAGGGEEQVLLPTALLLSASDSRSGTNTQGVRFFRELGLRSPSVKGFRETVHYLIKFVSAPFLLVAFFCANHSSFVALFLLQCYPLLQRHRALSRRRGTKSGIASALSVHNLTTRRGNGVCVIFVLARCFLYLSYIPLHLFLFT